VEAELVDPPKDDRDAGELPTMQTAENMLTQTGTYVIDPAHSRVGFAVRYAMVSTVRGSFNSFRGGGFFDIERPENSTATLTIATPSIDTRHPDRDAHLRGEDLFDAATHPTITFAADSVEQIGVRTYRVEGDLTIKGITNRVTLEVERSGWLVEPDGTQRIGFEGRGVINRRDWDLTWNRVLETGGVLVADQVTIEFEVTAIKTTHDVTTWDVPAASTNTEPTVTELDLHDGDVLRPATTLETSNA
jgi:polyisoprenoid-binding protein YceI